MREIKFRAWDNTKNSWYTEWENPHRSEWTPDDGHKEYSITSSDGSITLEQFTGLRDKNGKEIYEGDILHNPENYAPYNCVIEWREDLGSCGCCYSACESVGFVGKVLAGSDYVYSDLADGYKNMEVIGNIHENPELLK